MLQHPCSTLEVADWLLSILEWKWVNVIYF